MSRHLPFVALLLAYALAACDCDEQPEPPLVDAGDDAAPCPPHWPTCPCPPHWPTCPERAP